MPKIIKFDEPTHFEARGRNGYLPCYGIQLVNMGTGDFAEFHLFPISQRGKASEACRIPVRKSAIPALIKELLEMVGDPPPELLHNSGDLT
jgi:hypothetical protein